MADLLLNQLKGAIYDLLKDKGLKGSVQVKINHRGEKVIAAILDEICPACAGTGKKKYPAEEDAEERADT